MWPNRTLLDLVGTELPIIQAPMAGANGPDMAVAVSEAGGLGSAEALATNWRRRLLVSRGGGRRLHARTALIKASVATPGCTPHVLHGGPERRAASWIDTPAGAR